MGFKRGFKRSFVSRDVEDHAGRRHRSQRDMDELVAYLRQLYPEMAPYSDDDLVLFFIGEVAAGRAGAFGVLGI